MLLDFFNKSFNCWVFNELNIFLLILLVLIIIQMFFFQIKKLNIKNKFTMFNDF